MEQHEPCDKCGQKLRCREVFRQLGNAQGNSITRNVVMSFVLPLAIFIGVLALAQQLLTKYIGSVELRTAVAFLLAIVTAAIYVAVIRVVGKRLGKR